ncbi:MAG: dTDP-4-dehydrorhamnose 3,5-epimerase family protein [Patescibacteria group bacterium]|nr:dTDP-4-dehydrorhamnose 3,5-epimerase family protein [Patescibacteria group bacterium]
MAKIQKTHINGLWKIELDLIKDSRGFFCEVFRKSLLSETNYEFLPVQWNHSRSNPNVLRGFHANPWAKLIYPVGEVFIAIADIDPNSSTYKKVYTCKVSSYDCCAFFLLPMLANAYYVLGDKPIDYFYLVDKYYTEDGMRRIAWNDPELNTPWPTKAPELSNADKNSLPLSKI